MRPEPVLILDFVKAGVALAAGFGWVAVDDPLVGSLTTTIAGLLFVGLSLATRSRVTPVVPVAPPPLQQTVAVPPPDASEFGYGRSPYGS